MKKILCVLLISLFAGVVSAQNSMKDTTLKPFPDIKWKPFKNDKQYIQFTFLAQVWARFNQNNPGTLMNDQARSNSLDIGLRRVRMQVIGNVSPKFFFYTQIGLNNFNAVSARKPGIFFHDVVVEYHPVKDFLTIGGGLTGWTGFLRYSSPSVGTILMMDAPLYQQATNDINDQFLRKLSIYAKGKIFGLDYRVIVSDPFTVKTSPNYDPVISTDSKFTPVGHAFQVSGYFNYQFFDQESNLIPYNAGTYLGNKKVLNVGLGAEFQPNATWQLRNGTDTVFHPMVMLGADVFYDAPFGKNNDWAVSAYGAYSYTDFGPNYLRNLAVMIPTNGSNPSQLALNGPGNGFPAIGTGHTGFVQVGVKFPSKWFGKSGITFQPYAATQISSYDKLKDPMTLIDAGVNWFFYGHKSKLSLHYQNRPVFDSATQLESRRLNTVILQYQITI